MELLVLILNKTEYLKDILSAFMEKDIRGATILDSQGMAHNLCEYNELRFMGSLRLLLDPEHKESKTVLVVVEKEKIPVIWIPALFSPFRSGIQKASAQRHNSAVYLF